MTPSPAPATPFAYDHYELEPEAGRLSCHYSIGARRFTERVSFGRTGSWDDPAVDAAARLVFLLAGVSYYKTAAPLLIDLGSLRTTDDERAFLRSFFLEGLGEFAYRNELDLSDLALDGPPLDHRTPVSYRPTPDRPLVPFGGGIDSIVTVEEVRRRIPEAALFVVSPNGEPFDAIERPAAATGLPVLPPARGRPPGPAVSRAGLLERSRAGDRHPFGDRSHGGRPASPRRGGHVERVVGFDREHRRSRAADQPPVLQEPGLRAGVSLGARSHPRPGALVLLPAASLQ